MLERRGSKKAKETLYVIQLSNVDAKKLTKFFKSKDHQQSDDNSRTCSLVYSRDSDMDQRTPMNRHMNIAP